MLEHQWLIWFKILNKTFHSQSLIGHLCLNKGKCKPILEWCSVGGKHNESTSSAELFCIVPQEIKCLAVDLQDGTLDLSLYKRQPSLSTLPPFSKLTDLNSNCTLQSTLREHLLTSYVNSNKHTVDKAFGCSG